MAFFRQKAGLTQEELGKRLGGWTKIAVSAAERGWDGKRIRKFDADEILAIASVLGVPAVALLLPPADAGTAVEYSFEAGSIPVPPVDTGALIAHVLPQYTESESPTMRAFRDRVMALGASERFFQSADVVLREVAMEVLLRARHEADEILRGTRVRAEEITSGARVRAEDLERDLQMRWRQTMGDLPEQREQLERRIDDLRAFERAYRSRLLAYLEAQVRDLKAGVGTAYESTLDDLLRNELENDT